MRIPIEEAHLNNIKAFTPKWRWRKCWECKALVKKEPMWKRSAWVVCTKCAPTRFDAYERLYDKPFPSAK